jgi:hypothetical protein
VDDTGGIGWGFHDELSYMQNVPVYDEHKKVIIIA